MRDENDNGYPCEATIGDQSLRAVIHRTAGIPSRDRPPPASRLRELIAKKAYELYLRRGRIPGRALDDWLEAERIVLSQLADSRRQAGSASCGRWNPAVDLYETPEAFILEADLPGSKGRCRGRDRKQRTRAPRKEIFGTGLQRRQISLHGAFSGDFARRMKLPVSVDKEQIQTEFHGGVLRVILPKIGKRT